MEEFPVKFFAHQKPMLFYTDSKQHTVSHENPDFKAIKLLTIDFLNQNSPL